jgi:hypothetical protein
MESRCLIWTDAWLKRNDPWQIIGTQEIAGLLGVIGFPVAALLLSVALGSNENWRTVRRALLWIANLNWISVVLLVVTLTVMTIQMTRINGGHLPQHAPKSLPTPFQHRVHCDEASHRAGWRVPTC